MTSTMTSMRENTKDKLRVTDCYQLLTCLEAETDATIQHRLDDTSLYIRGKQWCRARSLS
jgi:hypothetical protein